MNDFLKTKMFTIANWRRLILYCSLVLLLAGKISGAWASTYNVNCSGGNAPSYPYTTVGAALNAAAVVPDSTPTINIQGTCSENIVINNNFTNLLLQQDPATGAVPWILNGTQPTLTATATIYPGNTVTINGMTSQSGGNFVNLGTLTLKNSTISGNSAGTIGGGIANGYPGAPASAPNLIIINSTISGNTANSQRNSQGLGGGIYNESGTVTVISSSISGNTVFLGPVTPIAGLGGGIYNESGTVTVVSSTISGNSADLAGAGIFNSNGQVNLVATIVAGNISDDIKGSFTSYGYNLFGSLLFSGNVSTDIVLSLPYNPNLNALANNGGSTQTMMPQTVSPAIGGIPNNTSVVINSVNYNLCVSGTTSDQRGAPRPGVLGTSLKAFCDIGAYETGGLKIAPSPASLAFMLTLPGSTSLPLSVQNQGNLVATFSTLLTTIVPPFSYLNNENVIKVDIGETKNFSVGFAPTSPGSFSGALSLGFFWDQNNDGIPTGDPTISVNVPLSGTASNNATQISQDIQKIATCVNNPNQPPTGCGVVGTAKNRLSAFVNMLTNAAALAGSNDFIDACTQLYNAALKADGSNKNPNPPDFIQDATNATQGRNTRNVYISIRNIMSTELFCSTLPPVLPPIP